MVYSSELLKMFKEVPYFKEDSNRRGYSDYLLEKNTCMCVYPIGPLGTYGINQKQSTNEKIQGYAKPLILGIGTCLAAYGFFESSPLALALGMIPLAFAAKEIGKEIAGFYMCPMAITGLRQKMPKIIPNPIFSSFHIERQKAHALMVEGNCSITNLKIVAKGVNYDAYFISEPENDLKKMWMIHALDGLHCPDWPLRKYPTAYLLALKRDNIFNHVIVAGPSVGFSTGWPAPENIGEGYAAVIRLLEQAGVTHIVMEGRGLFGGFTLAKAIEAHDFQGGKENKTKYAVISIGAASSLSETVKKFKFGRPVAFMIRCLGMDMDCNKMNQKLLEKNIQHLVIKGKNANFLGDGLVTDRESLWQKLEKENFSNVKIEPDSTQEDYKGENAFLIEGLNQFLKG